MATKKRKTLNQLKATVARREATIERLADKASKLYAGKALYDAAEYKLQCAEYELEDALTILYERELEVS